MWSFWDEMTEGQQVCLAGSEWDQRPLLEFPASLQRPQTRQWETWILDPYIPFCTSLECLGSLKEQGWLMHHTVIGVLGTQGSLVGSGTGCEWMEPCFYHGAPPGAGNHLLQMLALVRVLGRRCQVQVDAEPLWLCPKKHVGKGMGRFGTLGCVFLQ